MELKSGYKLSEVGIIPQDWKVKDLNQITTITRLAGYEYSSLWKESDNGEIIALRGFNIGKNKIFDKDFVRISNKLSLRLNRSRLYTDDIVYPCVGTIGNAVVIEEDDKYHIQQNIAKITPNKNEVSPHYLVHYLISPLGMNEVLKFNATSSQPNVLVGSLRKYKIIVPTRIEQTAIAQVLSDTDEMISSLEKLIEKKKLIKQGTMQQLLTGKKRLPGFSGEWEVKTIEQICIPNGVIRGPFGGSLKKEFFVDDGIKVYEQRNAIYRTTKLGTYYIDQKKYIELKRFEIGSGDFIISCSGTIGKIFQIPENAPKGIINQALLLLKVDNQIVEPNYFYYYFDWDKFQMKIIDSTQGGAMQNLVGMEVFKKTELILPPSLSEQRAISQLLKDIDTAIESLEQKLNKYKYIKQGMMQNLLTGKIRLI